MNRLKITNARTLDKSSLVDIHIEGTRIVTPFPEGQSVDRVIDAAGSLVVPGLIDPHTHLDKAGLSDQVVNVSGTVEEARKKMLEAKRGITMENIKQRARRVIDESIRSGVTAIRTHVDVDPIIQLRGMQALLELKQEYADRIDLQIVAFPQEGISEAPGTYDLMNEALRMGADVVGGHLSIARDYREHTEKVFRLGNDFDRLVDIHVDFNIERDYSHCTRHEDDRLYPDDLGVVCMAEEVLRQGYQDRAAASHLCGLDSIPPEISENVISLIKKAGIAVIALPPGNLFLQGRADPYRVRRGVTKVKDLLRAGVRVSFGPDNVRDPFNPIGSPNMIHNALLTTYACHMNSHEDFQKILQMCTTDAAVIMNLPDYGLAENCYADLVVLGCSSVEELLAYQPIPRWVIKHGTIVSESRTSYEEKVL